jgi:urea carboxylase
MPILLGPDGPSCGGFVCPAVVVAAERWKLGQLRPGDTVRFVRTGQNEAAIARRERRRLLAGEAARRTTPPPVLIPPEDAVRMRRRAALNRPALCMRQSGDEYLLVEYGEHVLDLALRLRVHLLEQALKARVERGIIDITPGIRSLQIHLDPDTLSLDALMDLLVKLDADLPALDEVEVPTRTVHLPLSWDDPATRKAIDIYMRSVRADAPWCPSNLEFIRRINGLDSIDAVKRIVFDADYLVMGLGDVYLGAPVATPLDPRHRLVTTKYNPARTWTPPNAVGIGGAYLCIYGMEGPGGYQFVGRTVPVWNTWKTTPEFLPGTPWLLRSFDILKWYEVEADELMDLRDAAHAGELRLRIEPGRLRWRDVRDRLDRDATDIARFQTKQRAAFAAERERWGNTR